MSSRGRGKAPHPLGAYYTDRRVADVIVERMVTRGILTKGCTVLEPSAGAGSFLGAVQAASDRHDLGVAQYAMDVDPNAPSMLAGDGMALYQRCTGDFTDPGAYPATWPVPSVVVGNPPYSVRVPMFGADGQQKRYPVGHKRVGQLRYKSQEVGTAHCLRALGATGRHVVFLMRSGFLGGRERHTALWAKWPPTDVWSITGRPSFTGTGTDSSEYSAYWWDLENPGDPDRWLIW